MITDLLLAHKAGRRDCSTQGHAAIYCIYSLWKWQNFLWMPPLFLHFHVDITISYSLWYLLSKNLLIWLLLYCFCLVITHLTTLSLCRQRETAAGENSHVAGGDAAEQPRQPTNHRETMTDPPGCLTEHQSNWALLVLHSSVLSSCLHPLIRQC